MTTEAVPTLICRRCRLKVDATPYRLEAGAGKYCGAICAKKALEEETPRTVRQQVFAASHLTSWWANCSREQFAERLSQNAVRMSAQAPPAKATLPE